MVTQRSPLDDMAEALGGPGTRVRDPDTFTAFLMQGAAEYDDEERARRAAIAQMLAESPVILPSEQRAGGVSPVITATRANYPLLAGGEPKALEQTGLGLPFQHLGPVTPFQSVLPEPVITALPEVVQRPVRNITSPVGLATTPWSPVRTVAGEAGSVAAERIARAAGASPSIQTAAAIAGGVVSGAPEVVPQTGRLAGRAAQATGRAVTSPTAQRVLLAPVSPALGVSGEGGVIRGASKAVSPQADFLDRLETAARNLPKEEARWGATSRVEPLRQAFNALPNTPRPLTHDEFVQAIYDVDRAGLRQTGSGADVEFLASSRPGQEAKTFGLNKATTETGDTKYYMGVRFRRPAAPTEMTPDIPKVAQPPQAVTQAPARPPAPPPAPPQPPVRPPTTPPVPPAGGVPPLQPPEDALLKATRILQGAKPLREETRVLRSQETGRRVGMGMRATKGLGPLEQESAFTRQLGGPMPIAEMKLAEQITTDDITTLSSRLIEARDKGVFRELEWKNASVGFRKTFGLDETFQPTLMPQLPQDGEILLMERVFGPDFAEAIIKLKQSGRSRFGQVMAEVIGAPKTLLSGPDLSAPLRQGLLLIPSHPVAFGRQFARSLKSFVSERNFIRYQSQIKGDADFNTLVTDGKLFFADPYAASAKLTSREEAYVSRLIQRLPELKQLGPVRHAFKPIAAAYKGSERAYLGYLNGVRYEVAKQALSEMRSAGVPLTDQAISLRMSFLNHATGRGTLGDKQAVLTALNAPFWSPGLQLSRFQVLGDYARSLGTIGLDEVAKRGVLTKFRADPAVRVASNQIAKEMTAFVAMGAAIITLIKLAIESKQPGFEDMTIEADPRSTDFGKIKSGETRIEFWGSFQPWVRALTQLSLRQEKDVNTGKIKEALAKDIGAKFLRTKLAPGVPALAGTAAFGYTYEGEKTELTKKQLAEVKAGKRPSPLQVWERELLAQFTSLTAQQITEIYQQSPRQAAATVPLSVLGAGVSNYGPPTSAAPSRLSPSYIPPPK